MVIELLPSDYVEDTELSHHGMESFAQAQSLLELTEVLLKLRGEDFTFRIEENNGLYDLIVLKRTN